MAKKPKVAAPAAASVAAPEEAAAPAAVAAPPPPATVTRVVRGPGRYLARRAGETVEVPREWVGKDPSVERCTLSLEDHEALVAARLQAKAEKRAAADGKPGLRELSRSLFESARAQLEDGKRDERARREKEATDSPVAV